MSGPILPIYIRSIIRNFPAIVKWGVIPVDNPTVPKAETASNSKERKDLSSNISKRRKRKENAIVALTTRARALYTTELGMVLLKVSMSSLPLKMLFRERRRIANVEVFIPPPVEPGEAPMNIRKIIIVRVTVEREDMDIVLKPAVLGVTAWNRDAQNFAERGYFSNAPSNSKKKMARNPTMIKIREVITTNLVWMEKPC